MGIVLFIAAILFAVIALLWVVNRRNPGDFGMKDANVHDKGLKDFLAHGKAPNRERL